MTALFAVTLGAGVVFLLSWLAWAAMAENVEGFRGPDERWGVGARSLPAGLAGCGIAGMSASYAGWPTLLSLLAALAAAIASAVLAVRTSTD